MKGALKRAAKDSHLAPKLLVADCLSTASQHTVAALPPISALKRNIHNARRGEAKYPKLPKHRKDLVIPDVLLHTQKGEDFLLHDSGHGDADRILIFGKHNNLSLLRRAQLWLVDGTFKTTPCLFYQLYTVHCIIRSETFLVAYCTRCYRIRQMLHTRGVAYRIRSDCRCGPSKYISVHRSP